MKIGPNWFTATLSSVGNAAGVASLPGFAKPTMTYYTQTVSVSFTSLPVDARGAYNKTFQLLGTYSSVTPPTNIAIDASIDPQALTAPATATWYTIGTLATPTIMLVHSGNVRAFRARTQAVSNTDNFAVAFMFDDAG